MEFQTRCVHVGVDKDSAYLSATTPIYPTSTFRWDDLETNRGFDYTRSGNPTRQALASTHVLPQRSLTARPNSWRNRVSSMLRNARRHAARPSTSRDFQARARLHVQGVPE